MKHRVIVKIAIGVVAFAQTSIGADAATLPPPAKLCRLIAASKDEGNSVAAPGWKAGSGIYYCSTTGVIMPSGGTMYMTEYDATGPTKTTAATVYFKFQIWDFPMKKDTVSAPILSRLSAVFAASGGGQMPDDLVQAVNNVTTATVQTALGVVRTRFTPSSRPDQPDLGAVFEVQIGK